MIAGDRDEAAWLAERCVDLALVQLYVAEKIRAVLIYQAFLFLMMGFDSTELRVWREDNRIEVIPSMLSDQ